jgi:hypothetical protein
MRMNEWVKELFFLIFGNVEPHGGMILTGENRRTRRKTCPNATLSTTNPTGLTLALTRAAEVRGQRLTSWATARPSQYYSFVCFNLCILIWFRYSNRSPLTSNFFLYNSVLSLFSFLSGLIYFLYCWDFSTLMIETVSTSQTSVTSTWLHGATSQKTAIFLFTVVHLLFWRKYIVKKALKQCFKTTKSLYFKRLYQVSKLVFWVVTPCGLVGRYQGFGGTHWLHQNWRLRLLLWPNFGICLQIHAALLVRRPTSTHSPPWETKKSDFAEA